MDMDNLTKTAVGAVIGALTKTAAEPVLAVGGKAWAWLTGKLGGEDATTAKAVEADPAKPSAPDKVAALLKDLLHADPAAAAELRGLLGGEAGVQAVTQTLTMSGVGNVGAQIVGSNNQVGNRR